MRFPEPADGLCGFGCDSTSLRLRFPALVTGDLRGNVDPV